jgi:sugar fermentation stimulation protein A
MAFRPGFYAYCGSARRNLSARVARHLARVKKKHWHIDYLTCQREVRVESVRLFPLDGWTECRLNLLIQRLPNAKLIHGFGSSDCTCASHLTFFGPNRPALRFEKNGSHGVT